MSRRPAGWRPALSPRSGAPIAVAVVLLVSGLVPVGSLLGGGGDGAIGIDVWLHVIGYAALSAALVLAAQRRSWTVLLGAAVLATAFGAAVELLQWPLPWRRASLLDALGNAAGATVGAWAAGLARLFGHS